MRKEEARSILRSGTGKAHCAVTVSRRRESAFILKAGYSARRGRCDRIACESLVFASGFVIGSESLSMSLSLMAIVTFTTVCIVIDARRDRARHSSVYYMLCRATRAQRPFLSADGSQHVFSDIELQINNQKDAPFM